jgi:hypothetical protein
MLKEFGEYEYMAFAGCEAAPHQVPVVAYIKLGKYDAAVVADINGVEVMAYDEDGNDIANFVRNNEDYTYNRAAADLLASCDILSVAMLRGMGFTGHVDSNYNIY